MAKVSKRLATEEGLQLIADAIKNTEAVQQAKLEIQAEGATQVANVQAAAEEIVGKVEQIEQNTQDVAELKGDLTDISKILGYKKDMSKLFNFTEGGGIAVGTSHEGEIATPSEVFCYTNNYIDISCYNGYVMEITVPIYRTIEGYAPAFGLCLYDENNAVIKSIRIKLGDRSIEKIRFIIPLGAKSIRTTFMINELNSFSCLVYDEYGDKLLKNDYTRGDIHFTVIANAYDGTGVETNCVLRLPSTYSKLGGKTPIVMIGHGSKGMVSNNEWYNSSADFNSFVQFLCDNGFAVFDVDNVDKNHISTEDCLEYGCPQLLNSYHKAFEWIKERYNIEDKLCIYGMSQGSFVAWNYPMFYRGDVKSCLVSGVRVGLKWLWDIYGNAELANKFGYNSAEYSIEFLKPFDIYTHIVNDSLTTPYVPCSLFYGGADTIGMDKNQELENALRNTGYYVESHTYDGISHNDITRPTNDIIRNNMLRFFKMFN